MMGERWQKPSTRPCHWLAMSTAGARMSADTEDSADLHHHPGDVRVRWNLAHPYTKRQVKKNHPTKSHYKRWPLWTSLSIFLTDEMTDHLPEPNYEKHFINTMHCCRASLVAQSVKKKKKKKSTFNAGDRLQRRKHGFEIWVGKIPYRRERLPTPVFLPRELHGQRSLVRYSPWGRKESDMT